MMQEEGKCPVTGNTRKRSGGTTNRDWWPNQLNLKMLHQNSPTRNPMGESFNYAEEFKKLDLQAIKNDLYAFNDRFTGVVAGRLRPLWTLFYPDGMAQRRDLSYG
jgi:catalase (peroxidase I)